MSRQTERRVKDTAYHQWTCGADMHTRHISGACQAAVSSVAHRIDAGADRCDDSVPLSELLVMLRDLPPQAQTHIHQSCCHSCLHIQRLQVRGSLHHTYVKWDSNDTSDGTEPVKPSPSSLSSLQTQRRAAQLPAIAVTMSNNRYIITDCSISTSTSNQRHQHQHQPTDFTTRNPSRHAHQRTQSWPQVTSGRSRT